MFVCCIGFSVRELSHLTNNGTQLSSLAIDACNFYEDKEKNMDTEKGSSSYNENKKIKKLKIPLAQNASKSSRQRLGVKRCNSAWAGLNP